MIHWTWLFTFIPALFMVSGLMYVQGGKYGDERYYEGIQDGQKLETADAERRAVETYKAAVQRRMHDAGRRYLPRDGATPSTLHKARITTRKPGDPLS